MAFGDGGCHLWKCGRWEPVPAGDARWDACHQQVYRNHRARHLDAGEMEGRGVPEPPAVTPTAPGESEVEEVALAGLAPAVRQRLAGAAPVYLLLEEDEYESAFGDGVFLYPKDAFWDAAAARARLEELHAGRPAEGLWYRYTLAEVPLEVDEALGVVRAAPRLPAHARCTLAELLELLARHAG